MYNHTWASVAAQMVKNPPAMQETWVPSPGWGRCSGEGNGSPLQCSCLENPIGERSLAGRGPWVRKEPDTERLSTAQHRHPQVRLSVCCCGLVFVPLPLPPDLVFGQPWLCIL